MYPLLKKAPLWARSDDLRPYKKTTMVWFNYTLSNMKGLFSFDSEKAYPMSNPNSKLPDYVEVTYNSKTHEFYFDWYTKERQEVTHVAFEIPGLTDGI